MISELEEDNRKKLNGVLASLEQLRRTTSESNRKSMKMIEILTLFDDRLAKLEETVQPVYKQTGNLQAKQEASNEALAKLDYVLRFYTIAGEVEQFIHQGLTPGAFDAYLSALDQLSRADDYFIKNNPHSPELLNVHGLLERGGNNVEKEFRQLLQQNCNPIPVISILNLIGKHNEQSEEHKEMTKESVKKSASKFAGIDEISLPDKRRQQLRTLSAWLTQNRLEDFVSMYALMRSDVLLKSLNNLWQYLRSSSLSNVVSAHNSLSSIIGPALGGQERLQLSKLDTPSQLKRPTRLSIAEPSGGNFGVGSSGGGLIKKLPNLGGVVRTSTSMADMKEAMAGEALSEREIVTYIIAVTGLFKLMQLEYQFIGETLDSDHHRDVVFSRVVAASLDRIRTEGEALCGRVKRCVQAKDFSSVLCLLPVYRYHTHMRHSFDMLLDGCDDDVQKRLHSLGVTLQTTISKALEEYIEFIKSDSNHRVPKDGTVHELTSNVMLFLMNLHAYLDILSRVIMSSDFHFIEEYSKHGWDKNQLTFALYIIRTLSQLGLSLMKKSEVYSDPTLQALFRMNNIHYIVRTLYKVKMIELARLGNKEIESHYGERMRTYKQDYLAVWNRLKALLYEGQSCLGVVSQQKTVMSPQYQQQHKTMPTTSFSSYSLSSAEKSEFKLKDKQRQAIKEKFSTFNKEFEAICLAQRSYAVPDVELRRELIRANRDTIVEAYSLFYNKYVQLDFTKNVHKYIKYTPEHVAQMIQMFFDQAA